MEITYHEYLELRAGLVALCQKIYSPELGSLVTVAEYVKAAQTAGLPQKDLDDLNHIQETDSKLQNNVPSE